jgi:hypothetical protein
MFRDKFRLSFALTTPVVLPSRDIQEWVGAISGSTIVVAANAQLLRRLRLRRDPPPAQPKLATA